MRSENIKQTIETVVLDLLPNLKTGEISDNDDIFSLGLDSINAMSLVLGLQEAFSITFDANDIDVDNFRTIASITELMAKKSPA
ncbi:MAG: acyl carrier protein [Leptolyngbya sp. SIO1D8]|nr:acyl carrier protein [Leptolyngbya sp. SIO1D8]